MQEQIERVLEAARQKLIETGTRNRLVHVNLENKRANALNVINERSVNVYEHLTTTTKPFGFLSLPEDAPKPQDQALVIYSPTQAAEAADRLTDNFLETQLQDEALHKRLQKLSRDARSVVEEQGFEVLYLALGFLTWFEDKSSAVPRTAPLILLPVALKQNKRTSRFELRLREEDLPTNLPLKQRLKDDFGIDLPNVDDTDSFDPEAYFAEVEEVIESKASWAVNRDSILLGMFSFAKMVMLRDLDPANWSEASLLDHPMLQKLLSSQGFPKEPPLFEDDEKLDKRLTPGDLFHVIPADTSQTQVIEEVRAGRNLVVQGPPGTGKSQTITNLIAGAIKDGKSVLFVAEKLAALQVVQKRLTEVGLDEASIELHSHKANKLSVVQALGHSADLADQVFPEDGDTSALKQAQDALNSCVNLLHDPISGRGYSPFQMLAVLVGQFEKAADFRNWTLPEARRWTVEQMNDAVEGLTAFADALQAIDAPASHPLRSLGQSSLEPMVLDRLKRQVQSASRMRQQRDSLAQSIIAQLPGESAIRPAALAEGLETWLDQDLTPLDRLTTPLDVQSVYALREKVRLYIETKSAVTSQAQQWRSEALSVDLGILETALNDRNLISQWFGAAAGARRTLRGLGPNPVNSKNALYRLQALKEWQELNQSLDHVSAALSDSVAGLGKDDLQEFEGLAAAAEAVVAAIEGEEKSATVGLAELWLSRRGDLGFRGLARDLITAHADWQQQREEVVSALVVETEWRQLLSAESAEAIETFDQWSNNLDHYERWQFFLQQKGACQALGLSICVQDLEKGHLSPSLAVTNLRYVLAETAWTEAVQNNPELATLRNIDRDGLVSAYMNHEDQRTGQVQREVRNSYRSGIPSGTQGAMGVIRGEASKRRRHLPIRKLVKQTASVLPRLKPVMLMSPLSVAQYIPPNTLEFDLLLIDEASQVRPEEALGAIARSKQIVVVGDQKQLPPTAFFDRMTSQSADEDTDDDETEEQAMNDLLADYATETESILSLCEARGVNNKRLRWHYRSQDTDLIAVSNRLFYDNDLIMAPSALQGGNETGLKYHQVPGCYSTASRGTGRAGTNQLEAQYIADRLAQIVRSGEGTTVGIVAFSVAQRDMILEVLDQMRREDQNLSDFLNAEGSDALFVKNIENVQGDERDVILISLGYGPIAVGQRLTSMNFGPVNREGGERRLNVLFTRAKLRTEVFLSFDWRDIDLSRASGPGVSALKDYLEFAATGRQSTHILTGEDFDSDFEQDVAEVIRALGYKVSPQVGDQGFRIDLGVHHPEQGDRFMLAVECDGATYHSALSARERDYHRQKLLESRGWVFHRIWSTDWFYRRSDTIQALRQALSKAVEDQAAKHAARPFAYSAPPHALETQPTPQLGLADQAPSAATRVLSLPYVTADLPSQVGRELLELSPSALAPLIKAVVTTEGPVHQDEIYRRIIHSFGLKKLGSRLHAHLDKAFKEFRRSDATVQEASGFVWFDEQLDGLTPRDRSEAQPSIQKAPMIADAEIKEALAIVARENGDLEHDDRVRAVAALFGFKRTGTELSARITEVIVKTL